MPASPSISARSAGVSRASVYYRGNGVDLGSVLEFRSSGEIAYRFEDRSRLGITAFHLSNASTGRINPGTEVVMLSYSMPITTLIGGKKHPD